MKASQFAELNQPRDDHLDVHVGRVVAQINEADRFRPKLAGAVIARPPIVDYRRIERRLIKLMLDKNPPIVGQRSVNLTHAFEIALERAAEVLLAGKIPAVADPDRVGFRAQRFPDLNAFEVVFDGLLAHQVFGMSKASEFVRVFLSWLILERVGVHRVEMQAALPGILAQVAGVVWFVPRDMQRYCRSRAD